MPYARMRMECSQRWRGRGHPECGARVALMLAVSFLLCLFLRAGPAAAGPPAADADSGFVSLLPVADAIGPVSAHFIASGIDRAEREHARAVIIQLDTPGGLDASMRQIVKAILGA